jgi:hypothetical protein
MKKTLMKRVSLKQVVEKCIWEPAFFRALLRDSKKTLTRARMHISARDQRRLRRLMADKKAMKDFVTYGSLIRKYGRSGHGILW